MDEDIRLKLLAGLPLRIDKKIFLYPLSLRKIADIGYSQYDRYLACIIAEPKDYGIIENVDNITTWDIILSNMHYSDDEYRKFIMNSLGLFLNKQVNFIFDKNIFYIDNQDKSETIIDQDIFGKIKYYLKLQNCIVSENELDDFGYRIDHKDEKSKKMLEKLRKEKEKLRKAKSNNSQEKLYLSDLISILASNSNLSIIDIFELDMFRFQDQFNRMQMLDEYKVNIQSLLAGANPKEVKLKHFIGKIDKD